MQGDKVMGIDEISIEVIKCLKYDGIDELVNLCNLIYDIGICPAIMIPIPEE